MGPKNSQRSPWLCLDQFTGIFLLPQTTPLLLFFCVFRQDPYVLNLNVDMYQVGLEVTVNVKKLPLIFKHHPYVLYMCWGVLLHRVFVPYVLWLAQLLLLVVVAPLTFKLQTLGFFGVDAHDPTDKWTYIPAGSFSDGLACFFAPGGPPCLPVPDHQQTL